MTDDRTLVDAEAIPDELKERDQWMVWDRSNDAPRRPAGLTASGRLDWSASWKEPDDWLTFEDAAEAARERESVGVGYVFARGNDDYPRGLYGALDIDGALDDDGTPADWLPPIDPFTKDHGGYVEQSPSGEGLRVPLVGFEPPEWWTDVTKGEHEGVEAEGSKFQTITGDAIRGAGDEPAEAGPWVEDWLAEVHENVHGEPPAPFQEDTSTDDGDASSGNVSRTSGRSPDATTDPGKVFDAVDALDMEAVAEKTIVHGWNDDANTSDGNRAFYPTWGPDCNGTANIVDGDGWTDTGGSGRGGKLEMAAIDMGELAHHEAEHGAVDGKDALDAAEHLRGLGFDVPELVPESELRESLEREHGSPDGGAAADGGATTAESADDELPPRLRKAGGGYEYVVDPGRADEDETTNKVSNFQLETLARLHYDGEDDDEYRLRVHPERGESYEVTVEPVVFNEVRDFRGEVPTGWGTTWDGGHEALSKLKEHVAMQDAPDRRATRHIGRHGEEWVAPTGTLTGEEGWTDDPKTVFAGRGSPLEDKWTLDPDDDAADREEVQRILELLPRVRPAERWLPAVGWFYAATFRPLVMDWEGEFNLLNVLGDSGAGKTASLELLWSLFGMDSELLRADSTGFSILSSLAATNALPVVLDEYKPADMREYRVDQLHSWLRTNTRGGAETRGNPDMSVDTYRLQAPVCIAGEQPLQGPAEERRSILTTFTRRATVDSTGYAEAFKRLAGGGDGTGTYHDGADLEAHALAFHRWALRQDRDELRDAWRESRDVVRETLTGPGHSGLDDIVIQGYQTVRFGVWLYRRFAVDMGVDVDALPVRERDVTDTLRYLAGEGSGARHRSHLDRFMGLAARAAAADYMEQNEHYTHVDSDDGLLLVIDMDTAFDQVRRYARDHDVHGEDILDSVSDYRGRIRDAVERDTYVVDTSRKARPIGRGVAFDAFQAADEVEGLTPGRFFPEMNDGVDSDESDEFDDVASDYLLVQGTILSFVDPPPWLEAKGTMTVDDDGSKVNFQATGDSNPFADVDEGDHVVVRDAILESDEQGNTVVEARAGVTEVAPIDEEQAALDESDESTATADGGRVLQGDRRDAALQEVTRLQGQYDDGAPRDVVLDALEERGADRDESDHTLDKLLTEGELREPVDGHLRR